MPYSARLNAAAPAGGIAMSMRAALVVAQISLAFMLLIGSGLLTMTFMRLMSVDPGFRPENVLPRSCRFRDRGTRTTGARALRQLTCSSASGLSRRARAPGATTYLPFSGNNNSSAIHRWSAAAGAG